LRYHTNVSIVYGSHDANAADDAGIMKCIAEGAVPTPGGGDTPDVSAGRSGLIYTGCDGSKYVRVRPLVKKNGKAYYGALCGKKKVSLRVDL